MHQEEPTPPFNESNDLRSPPIGPPEAQHQVTASILRDENARETVTREMLGQTASPPTAEHRVITRTSAVVLKVHRFAAVTPGAAITCTASSAR
jgi:hypothetical protein